jgi:hypothetical protein
VIETRPGRPSPFRVRRLEGKLTASFSNRDAAEMQDALWARWREQIPVLADRQPTLSVSLRARLLGSGGRELSPTLLGQLLAAHPARNGVRPTPTGVNGDGVLLGEYVVEFFPRWAEGRLPGRRPEKKGEKTTGIVEDGLHRIVFQTRWERDHRGWRTRDINGDYISHGWGDGAIAWVPLRDLSVSHVAALDAMVRDKGIGLEVWRKVRSFLKQLVEYAQLEELYPEERRNPVTAIPAPAQTGVKIVRRPYPPEIVEKIRADFLHLEELAAAGVQRSRGNPVETPAGVPVPPLGLGAMSADLVEALAYGGFRPGEAFAARGSDYAPDDLDERYLRISQRNVNGQIVPGTKSRRYPEKDVYLLGPLPGTLARRAEDIDPDDLLFPYPGTNRPWTEEQYRNWRDRYFAPIARRHGLGAESDDVYGLRHVYATLRIAAHHPTLHIERSMGTSLVGKVYGDVIARYEGKGPLDIDAEIAAARRLAEGAVRAK